MDVYQRAKSQIAEDRVLTSRLPGAKASAFLLLVRSEKSDIGSAKYFSNGQQVHAARAVRDRRNQVDTAPLAAPNEIIAKTLQHCSQIRAGLNPVRDKFLKGAADAINLE